MPFNQTPEPFPELARGRARRIIEEYGITDPRHIRIEDIAAARNAYVVKRPMTGADGRLTRRGSVAIIAVRDDIQEPGRVRFTIAHELGHFELHKKQNLVSVCSEDDLNRFRKRTEPLEFESNVFAAEILMPETLFAPRLKGSQPSMPLVSGLAEEFGTSLTAAAFRYVELASLPCAIVVSQGRKVKWFKANDDFGFGLVAGGPLGARTVAISYFAGGSLPGGAQKVSSPEWLKERRRLNPASYVFEDAKALPSYGLVLSLIWYNEDID